MAPRQMVITHCKMGNFLFLDGKITSTQLQFGCITWALCLQGSTLCTFLLLLACFLCFSPLYPCDGFTLSVLQMSFFVLPISFSLCDKMYVVAKSWPHRSPVILKSPHSTLSLPALQLEQLQQTSRDTRLFSKYLHCGFYGQTWRLGPSRLSEGCWTPEHSASILSKRWTSASLFLPSKSTSCVLSVQLTPHYREIT